MSRCAKRVPNPPLPAGLPVHVADAHPRFAHLTTPGAQCELDAGHEGRHSAGLLRWFDPPVIFVGGRAIA